MAARQTVNSRRTEGKQGEEDERRGSDEGVAEGGLFFFTTKAEERRRCGKNKQAVWLGYRMCEKDPTE